MAGTAILAQACRKCGATIFPEGTNGFCGACLLETGLGPLEDEGEEAAGSTRALMDFGDYELLEEIGRGGQGVVYRARQKTLNRAVALKVIGLGHWATEAHVKRFRLEAEAAARLEHPGIVPIYEVGERDGSCYFSMKLVEGGQLDEVVRREPMPLRRAVEIAVKLARTVHYAHEHGILHRDIKPGNVLLDRNGDAHLTDFGLAKLVETESAVTNTFDVLGTPSYMAPEQAAGKTKELTAAADVYGLGAVFYQLLTGQPPFAGGTTYETIRLVMETEPRRPSLWNRKVDRDLETIALKCLEKDPQKRYPTALALAEDLEHWLRDEPIRARPTGIFTRSRKWVRRNPAPAVLVPSLLALAVALGALFWNRESQRPPTTGVAVLPFENLSDDKDNAVFADGVQDDILTKLAKVAELKVISRTSVMQYRGARNTRNIGQALRVSHVLEGSVRKAGGRIHLNAQLIDTRTDTHVWAEQYDRELSEIFAIQGEIAHAIVKELKAHVSQAENGAIEKKPTPDMEAYEFYLRAKELLYRTSMMDSDAFDKWGAAIELLEKAVARDPNFALAYCSLAEVNLRLYWQPGKPPEWRARAEAALNTARRLAPEAGETHLADALYFYWGNADYGHALEELEIAARLLPNSADVFRLSAWVERRLGRWSEGLRHLAKAVELDPRDAVQREELIRSYTLIRRYKEAARVADQAIAEFPNSADRLQALKGQALLAQGDLKEARAVFESYSPTNPNTVEQFLLRFNLAFYERNYAEAERSIATRLQLPHREFLAPDTFFKAVVARAKGDTEQATSAFLNCRQDLAARLQEKPTIAIWISTLALVDAGLGRKEDALRESARAIELSDPLERSEIVMDQANIYCWLGDRDRALEELAKISKTAIGVSHGDLRFNPAWDSLRDDPRFAQILADSAVPIPLQ
ncbi:MAG: protein kinase [Verrucomicrobiota bacterium]|nr:protein kinase [Verrucomicrobiota bacterium]